MPRSPPESRAVFGESQPELVHLGCHVEIKPLAQMLEDLLYEASDDGIEVCLAEAVCDARADRNAVRIEYQHRYQRAVDTVCVQRGEPSFRGRAADSGYPTWLRADQATCWSDDAGTVYLGLREGPENICMIGGGYPHPVKSQAVTLLPPSD
jgi:hypothetical protein